MMKSEILHRIVGHCGNRWSLVLHKNVDVPLRYY